MLAAYLESHPQDDAEPEHVKRKEDAQEEGKEEMRGYLQGVHFIRNSLLKANVHHRTCVTQRK
jgi:hypothetical protein